MTVNAHTDDICQAFYFVFLLKPLLKHSCGVLGQDILIVLNKYITTLYILVYILVYSLNEAPPD